MRTSRLTRTVVLSLLLGLLPASGIADPIHYDFRLIATRAVLLKRSVSLSPLTVRGR
jgi:hypothetical protein